MKLKVMVMSLSAFSGLALAAGPGMPNFSADSLSVSSSVGVLSGEAKELVYDPDTGSKVSELDWKIKNAAILKGELSWEPWSFMTLTARGWTTLAQGSGNVDDFDWLVKDQSSPSHKSSTVNTPLNYANTWDLSITGWALNNENFKLGGVAGYMEQRFSWTAIGGNYNYENGKYQGKLPDVAVLGYRQKFSMPYLGLTGVVKFDKFTVTGLIKGSLWATGKDNDEHYMTTTSYHEKSTQMDYYSAAVNVGYQVTPSVQVYTEFAYDHYASKIGDSSVYNYKTGEEGEVPDSSGMSNKNYNWTAGLRYDF